MENVEEQDKRLKTLLWIIVVIVTWNIGSNLYQSHIERVALADKQKEGAATIRKVHERVKRELDEQLASLLRRNRISPLFSSYKATKSTEMELVLSEKGEIVVEGYREGYQLETNTWEFAQRILQDIVNDLSKYESRDLKIYVYTDSGKKVFLVENNTDANDD